MTRESDEFPGCVEVPITGDLTLPGVRTPIAFQIEGVAISMKGHPVVEKVAVHGYDDADGDRQVLTTEETDPFRRAIAAALFKKALEPWVRWEFQDQFTVMGIGQHEAAQERAHNFRVVT